MRSIGKTLLFLIVSLSFVFLSGCFENNTPKVDYQAVVDSAKEELKIKGVVTVVNVDFTVPTEVSVTYEGKEYTVSVAWLSSEPTVISIDGTAATVTRPAIGTGDAEVTLTATLSLQGKSASKEFELTVYEQEITSEMILDAAAEDLAVLMADMNLEAVTENLTLPTLMGMASISWQSSDNEIVSVTGNVTRPLNGLGNATVTLTAVLSHGAAVKNVPFTVVVLESEAPADDLRASEAANYLMITTENVVADLVLPTTGLFGTTISWSSSDESIISNDGKVTRPQASGEMFVEVVLTATITYDQYEAVKSFVVKVLELEPANNQEKIAVDYNRLGLDFITTTAETLELPTLGTIYGATFSYVSKTDGVVVDGATVNIVRSTKDYIALVTVTGTLEGAEVEFELAFVVKSTDKGSGTENDPFVVTTVEDLEKIGSGVDGWNMDSHYALYANIDLSEKYGEGKESWIPLGRTETAYASFTGVLEGNGFAINGLYIVEEAQTIGLFGKIDGAKVSNLVFTNAHVEGVAQAAVLAGVAYDGEITNLVFDHTYVSTSDKAGQSGTLFSVATPVNGLFIDQVALLDIEVYGPQYAGGLIGRAANTPKGTDNINVNGIVDTNFYMQIKNVYVSGNVYGIRRVGGLVGQFTGYIENAIIEANVLPLNNDPLRAELGGQTHSGLLIGTIQLNGAVTIGYTKIVNVLTTGSIEEIHNYPTDAGVGKGSGRHATAIGDMTYNPMEWRTTEYLKAIYTTNEPIALNSLTPYVHGLGGEQVSEENAKSVGWYSVRMPEFDFANTWAIKEGYPTLVFNFKNALLVSSILNLIDVPFETTEDLSLATTLPLGRVTVQWESDSSYVGTDGKVTRPAYEVGDVDVNLTASFVVNGVTYKKEFVVKVVALEATADQKFDEVKAEIDAQLGDLEEVTEDKTLPTTGKHGATISWKSDSPFLTAEGVVTRPEAGEEDAVVTLVATVTIDGETRTFTYEVTVKAHDNFVLAVEEAMNAVTVVAQTAENVVFPTSFNSSLGVVISIEWESSHAANLAADGKVNRPSFLTGDVTVTLTATFSVNGEASQTKTYTVVVLKAPITPMEVQQVLPEMLPTSLTADYTLPTFEGVTVTYSVNGPDGYLTVEDGQLIVVRPPYAEGDATYTLTCLIEGFEEVNVEVTVIRDLGDGSAENPFIILTAADFAAIGTGEYALDAHYLLDADLDLSEIYNAEKGSFLPIGTSAAPFAGSLDGNGHTITGLYINQDTVSNVGLFGYATSLTIKNITFVNASVTGKDTVGVVAGRVFTLNATNVNIVNSYVKAIAANSNAGGFAGLINAKGTRVVASRIYMDIEVDAINYTGGFAGDVAADTATYLAISDLEIHGTVTGFNRSAGIIGRLNGTSGTAAEGAATILKNIVSYVNLEKSTGTGQTHEGGLLGETRDLVNINYENIIMYGSISPDFNEKRRGSIIGYCAYSATLPIDTLYAVNAFALNGTAPGEKDGVVAGTNLEAENIKNIEWYQATFASMDFDNVWKMGENGLVLR